MSKCSVCKTNPSELSAVVSGVFYKDLCRDCKALLHKGQSPSSGHARWERSIDAEDHEGDIQQPYNADGTINVKFAKLYPKQAKELFSEEQIRNATLK